MKKLILCIISLVALVACGDKETPTNQQKSASKTKKEVKAPVEKIDSTQLKLRQEEIIRQDSIQRVEEEKKLKKKQECATKIVFLENFYNEYVQRPRSAVEQYCSDRLLSELRSQAYQYEGNTMPIWVFALGNGGGNISWKVNVPDDESGNVFTVNVNCGGQRATVYLTVIGRDGYYQIDRVKNPTEGY